MGHLMTNYWLLVIGYYPPPRAIQLLTAARGLRVLQALLIFRREGYGSWSCLGLSPEHGIHA